MEYIEVSVSGISGENAGILTAGDAEQEDPEARPLVGPTRMAYEPPAATKMPAAATKNVHRRARW